MKNTVPPDHQIVTFSLCGVTYRYVGSTQEVTIVAKQECHIDLSAVINSALKRSGPITHIPASDQIIRALAAIGEVPEDLEYFEDQPEDDVPTDAIS